MKKNIDWIAVSLYAIIVLFGWVNIYAACFDETHARVFDFTCQHGKQIIWIGIAFIFAVTILYIEPRFFSHAAYALYGITIVLLIATLFIGTKTNGGLSWINFGAFKFQPSEFAKFATALALAKYMSTLNIDIKNRKTQLTIATITAIPMGLILLQHDTGSALVFLSFILPLYREGMSPAIMVIGVVSIILFVLALLVNKYILIGIVAACCLIYLFIWLSKRTMKTYIHVACVMAICTLFIFSVDFTFEKILEPHQRDRIYVLLGKTDDIKDVGYNVHQSKIAIGSGGFIGKGFLGGTITKADFVPEQETDFIFCTVGEEWGFVGSTIVIALYIFFLIRLITIAERQRSTFARFYGYATASIIFIHLLINVGMVLGLVPVIGIPLPLFSYGGSSLLAFTIMIFILIRQDAEKNILL